ncbi:MAG: hypothetical protein AAF235_10400, partial [Planctomycetota bacterium]
MSSGPRPVGASINSWSGSYLDEQYALYLADPDALDTETRAFFRGFDLATAGELKFSPGSGGTNGTKAPPAIPGVPAAPTRDAAANGTPAKGLPATESRGTRSGRARITPGSGQAAGTASYFFQAVVDDLITAYRDSGHLAARIDPFGRPVTKPASLTLEHHNIRSNDLEERVDGTGLGLSDDVELRDVIARLEETYCGTVGVEFMHIQDAEQRAWLFERFERIGGRLDLSRGEKAHILELLTRSEMFERFLGKRYPGEKRFSLEGSESLIPLLDRLAEAASELNVEEVVLGMAHRGRLNVLNTVIGKSYEQIFTEFEESWTEDFLDGG